jgi:DNA-binding NarL/FixJ family response regulator
MTHTVCFIDDSKFEHDLVANEIAPLTPDIKFIQAYTFDEARNALGEQKPALFLLDLWGQDPQVVKPYILSKDVVEKRLAGIPTIADVYDDLEHFQGDVNNEFLKRFFSIVEGWRSLFEDICSKVGQNRKYGLSNLKQVRESYPGVPAVFYTRKSLINDAVAMFQAGTDGLFIKPTGVNNDETRRLTREYAPRLATGLRQIIEG